MSDDGESNVMRDIRAIYRVIPTFYGGPGRVPHRSYRIERDLDGHSPAMTSAPQDQSTLNTIYVGDLPRNFDRNSIVELFKPYGDITEISTRILQQTSNAFVTFATHEQAANAIHECNYTKINGIPIHVVWRDTHRRVDPNSNLVLTNLPSSVDESSLHEALQAYGDIVSCRINRNRVGESTGVGFVQFSNAENAQQAYNTLQNAMIQGQVITVDFFKPIDKRQDVQLKLPPNVLCVDGPSDQITEANLHSMLIQYGMILYIVIFEGLGIVFFDSPNSASRAIAEFKNDKFTVQTTVRKEIQQAVLRIIESRRVYVSDLTDKHDGETKEHLESVGKLVSLDLHPRSPGNVVGVAQYGTVDEQKKALAQLDRTTFHGQIIPIRVLPFYDKRLEHPPAGFLQVNELGPRTTMADLRQMFSAFEPIIAVSLAPTSHLKLVGNILFEHFEQAVQAHEKSGVPNTFVYPSCDATDIVGAFCDNLKNRCVVVYDIPAEYTYNDLCKEFEPLGMFDGFRLSNEGGVKTGFVDCHNREDVINVLQTLHAQGRKADLIGSQTMARAGKMLQIMPMLKEYQGRLLYLVGIDREMNNQQLREFIEEKLGPVESVSINYNVVTFESAGSAILLLRDINDATEAKQRIDVYMPGSNSPIQITNFVNKRESSYRSTSQPTPQVPPVVQYPQTPGANHTNYYKRPRETLKSYISHEAALSPEHKDKLHKAVDNLCVDDIYKLLFSHDSPEPTSYENWMNENQV